MTTSPAWKPVPEEEDPMITGIEPHPADAPSHALFPLPQTARARVLVVEDDDEMRSLVEEILREEGYRTIGVPDTLSALMRLFADGADIVVTDWKMPTMDGLELLSSIRRCLPDLPVVFVTAYADPGLRLRAMAAGASSFLPKPFDRNELLAHIKAALAFERVRREQRSSD
jgi:CheY-like chemotaxis protein